MDYLVIVIDIKYKIIQNSNKKDYNDTLSPTLPLCMPNQESFRLKVAQMILYIPKKL